MMDGIRQYILGLVTAALLCGILLTLTGDSRLRQILKLVCGVSLTIAAIRPIIGLDLSRITDLADVYAHDAAEAVSAGEKVADDLTADIIKAECEAYILDKAAELDTQIRATVTLRDSEPYIPVAVHISGNVTPYIRLRLEEIIQEDLGITKENQEWTG